MIQMISLEFFLFLAVVVIFYYLVPKKQQWGILLLFSLLFYAFHSSLVYLLCSSLVTYFFSLSISKREKYSKWKLWIGIIFNIGLLIVLKYDLFSYVDDAFSLIVPLGISYYTLSSISYLVDTYQKKISPDSYFQFLLSISFFPTLIQGPINRYTKIKDTLLKPHSFSRLQAKEGLLRILWGCFKKLVIANRISILTSYIVTNEIGGLGVVLGLLLYGIQIYTDFSSGIDIVIGFSRILQINLLENFDTPYFSKNLNEFWKRWHISLTSWFRDYVYIPLGGNRVSKLRNSLNILIVFLLSGMWHGPTWNFFLWGLCNGILLVMEKRMNYQPKKPIFMLANYGIVCVLWIFFMYPNLSSILSIFHNTNTLSLFEVMSLSNFIVLWIAILFLGVVEYQKYKKKSFSTSFKNRDYLLLILFIFIIILFGSYGIGFEKTDFIYSRF